MSHKQLLLSLLFAASSSYAAFAQHRVDARLHRADDGASEILILPEADFDGVLSSLVITLSWDSTPTSAPPLISQSPMESMLLPMAPSGPTFTEGGRCYRKFVGLGMIPMHEAGARLQQGKSFRIGRIEGAASGSVAIVDAPWLKDRRHNGAYYISLNGQDKTGRVIGPDEDGAASAEQGGLILAPNPYHGGPLSYTLSSTSDGKARLVLMDANGKRVMESSIAVRAGINNGSIMPPSLAAGSYTARVTSDDQEMSFPFSVVGR